MINVLGFKRVAVLCVLLGLNAFLAWGVYMHLQPEKIKKDREFRVLQSENSTLARDIEDIQVEFDKLQEQRIKFDELREIGFFDRQGRREAELKLARAQTESGVISAIAKIESGKLEDNKAALKSDHKVLSSEITIEVEALSDVDVFHYIDLIEGTLPGYISVEEINLNREADLSRIVLQSIANGKNPPLVKANIRMMWKTMIADESKNGEAG